MLRGCTDWPAELAERYRREGYWQGQTLGAQLREWARRSGARDALVAGEERLSYEALDAGADRLAAGLAELGLRAGDRVVVQLPNAPELVTLCFALFRLGALPVLALPGHRANEISYLCEFSAAAAYVIPDHYAGFDYRTLARELDGVPHVLVAGEPEEFTRLSEVDADPVELDDPDPGDVALFLLSGGTTALPKLIPRTHDDYSYAFRRSAENAGFSPDSVYLAVVPVTHNYGLAAPGVLGTLWAGGTVVLATAGSPEEAFELIARERVTVTGLVPPLALLWLDAAATTPSDLSSLELIQIGGAKLTPEAARRVEPVLGCRLQQSFGMAEGLLTQSRHDDSLELRTTTQGHPISPADEVRVVDEDERDVAAGAVGQLLTRGPYTLRGYYRADEYNARAFTADGWLRTGDLVRILASGHLVVEGRAKDLINRGGDKVSAEEVEDHLLAHPGVRSAAVVAMPDAVMGERTCAFVVGDAPGRAELTRFLRSRGLATYKLPDRVEPIDALPETNVGKVDKQRLRELASARLERKG